MPAGFVLVEIAPPPERAGEAWVWRGRLGGAHLLFVGRGAPGRDTPWPAALLPAGVERAWLRQVHAATVREARAGDCGEGDALLVGRTGLAAIVAVADCVPVLLAGARGLAAVHAGWRGLVAGVLPAALARLGRIDAAWIGPAIGPCCYEVSAEVAAAVVTASAPAVRRPGWRGRPHLDLAAAAAAQLAAAGVGSATILRHCTRCRGEWLESHRRDGGRAGRNLAAVWREAES